MSTFIVPMVRSQCFFAAFDFDEGELDVTCVEGNDSPARNSLSLSCQDWSSLALIVADEMATPPEPHP